MSTAITIKNISELVTLAPLGKEQRITDIKRTDLGIINNAWLAIEHGKVKDFGHGEVPPPFKFYRLIDADKSLLMPGLVDCHTHPIYAGTRAKEFALRLTGKTYAEIADAGGGINFTVNQTRAASDQELKALTAKRLDRFLQLGVTTCEVKSGYGLSVKDELRCLEILTALKQSRQQHLEVTCLALHAVPPEYDSTESYVKDMTDELLPTVARQKLAAWVDAFIEKGYFSVEQIKPYIERAKELGLGIRLHADEFSDTRGGLAAAKWGAASADHLQFAADASIKAMAKAKTVATLLPGTSLYTNIKYTDAGKFINYGCPVALATDFNPGSCQIDNLAFIATLGALHCGLNLEQAVAAVTYLPAYSLNLKDSKGALAPGFDADFLIYEFSALEEWLADFGKTAPAQVYIKGQRVI